MNRVMNPIFLLIPAEMMGALVVAILMFGGAAIALGARKLGGKLVLGAIALPVLTLVIEMLFDAMFEEIPALLVLPIAFLITLAIWAMLAWSLLYVVFDRRTIQNAKGILLADAIRTTTRPILSRPLLLLTGLAIAYVIWINTL